jgi:hypothetical protein
MFFHFLVGISVIYSQKVNVMILLFELPYLEDFINISILHQINDYGQKS